MKNHKIAASLLALLAGFTKSSESPQDKFQIKGKFPRDPNMIRIKRELELRNEQFEKMRGLKWQTD